jgi:ankyrin repeat protein
VVERLIAHGADVRQRGREAGRTPPLILAASRGHTEVVRKLLEAGADASSTNRHKITALMHAANRGDLLLVQLLLSHGARVDQVNWHGRSALVYGVARGHPDIVRELLEAGAKANIAFHIKANGELTPLALTAARGDQECLVALLEHGAEVDAFSDIPGYGMTTALMLAVRRGHRLAAEALLEKGADPTVVDGERETPLERARALGQGQLLRSLEEAAAIANAGSKALQPKAPASSLRRRRLE